MALDLRTGTAKLTIDLHGSKPTVHVGSASILVCCNKNEINEASANGNTNVEPNKGPAVSITGTVFMAANANEFEPGSWEFGMVQVTQLAGYRFLYAGSTSAQGSIAVDRMGTFTKNPSLDVRPHAAGETVDQRIFSKDNLGVSIVEKPERGLNITVFFEDHPTNFMPLRAENRVARAPNFIARAYRNQAFITYFMARENAQADLICLGRVGWHFVTAAEFKWKTGVAKPDKKITESMIYPGEVRLGAPPADDSHFVIARTRATPTTQKMDDDAEAAINAYNDKVVKQAEAWPDDLHADFFK